MFSILNSTGINIITNNVYTIQNLLFRFGLLDFVVLTVITSFQNISEWKSQKIVKAIRWSQNEIPINNGHVIRAYT